MSHGIAWRCRARLSIGLSDSELRLQARVLSSQSPTFNWAKGAAGGDVRFQSDLSSAVIREGPVSCDARCWNRARQTPHVAAEAHSPDSRNRNMAGHVWLPNARSAGSRCGHRHRTRILVETVLETVVKPMTFLETVFTITEV